MARLTQPVGHQEAQMGPCVWTHFSSWAVWAGQCRRWTQGFQGVCSSPHIQSQQNTDPQYLPYILPSLPLHASGTFYLSGFQSWGRPSRQAPCLELGQTGTTESQSWKKPPQRPRLPRPLSPDENSEGWGHPWGRSWQRPRIPTPAWPALPSLLEARGWVRTGGRQSWKHPSLSGWAVPPPLPSSLFSDLRKAPQSTATGGPGGPGAGSTLEAAGPGTTPAEENGGEPLDGKEAAVGVAPHTPRPTPAPALQPQNWSELPPLFLHSCQLLLWTRTLLPSSVAPAAPHQSPQDALGSAQETPSPDAVFAARRRERMGRGLHPGLRGCSSCPPSGV